MRALFLLSCLAACSSQQPGAASQAEPWLTDARILVQGVGVSNQDCRTGVCQHNENTDLITYKGAIYLVHRTARSQVLGPDSSLRIYRSTDQGKSFVLQARIEAPQAPEGRDIRDPHFYIVGDRLYIKALTRLPVLSSRDSDVDTIAVESHSSDGNGATWSPLQPIGPPTWSFWRIRQQGARYYTAAYEDGDKSVVLFASDDGTTWQRGATIYDVSADTPLETELMFLPSGRMLALVRMDGTTEELLGDRGRLRTKVCGSSPPYDSFSCPQELMGQRLDGPLGFFWQGRLFVVARKHLPTGGRKRTSLFEITGMLDGGTLAIKEWGELPSAGDTAYAGGTPLDDHRMLLSWYSGDLAADETWVLGQIDASDIWQGTVDLSLLQEAE